MIFHFNQKHSVIPDVFIYKIIEEITSFKVTIIIIAENHIEYKVTKVFSYKVPFNRISIIQEKTKPPLVLPLSSDAGNSLYSYLSSSRPKAENNHVFIRHKAPFGRLTIKSCENAFKAALPEMADRPGVSFHTLRRTFATGILRNNAGMDAVMDALGHHDNSTAVKYLSFDDERMMECPLSLSGIAVEGGAL